MSVASEIFASGGGESPEAINFRIRQAQEQAANKARADAAALAQHNLDLVAQETNLAQATQNAPRGPTALEQLEAQLPTGFENTYAPSTLDDAATGSLFNAKRQKADEFIANMLKRGTLTDTGKAAGVKVLNDQNAKIKNQIDSFGNLLLEQERAGLRGIGNEAVGAAGGVPTGGTFDASPYISRINQSVASFQGGLPSRLNQNFAGDLFDTSGIGDASGGAVTGSQNVAYDPYAVAGGKLSTGTEDQTDTPTPSVKRRTSVF